MSALSGLAPSLFALPFVPKPWRAIAITTVAGLVACSLHQDLWAVGFASLTSCMPIRLDENRRPHPPEQGTVGD